MSKELKPCPFCGSRDIKDHEKKSGYEHSAYIQCHRCHARTGFYTGLLRESIFTLRKEAEAAWNRRVSE